MCSAGRDAGVHRGWPSSGAQVVTRWWLDRSLRSKGLLVLTLPLSMLVAAAVMFFLANAQADAQQEELGHTREAEAGLAELRALVVDGETGLRAFLATGDEAFLEPTLAAGERSPVAVEELGARVAGDQEQTARLAQVRQHLEEGFQFRAPADLEPTAGPESLRAWLLQQKASTDAIRDVLAQMADAEQQHLAAALEARDAWRSRARLGSGVAVVLGVAGGLVGVLAFAVGITRRLERLQVSSEEAPAGRASPVVDAGADEIGVLSRRLADVTTGWQLGQDEATAARRAAEHASRAKNDFLSRMSHELRTPLNAVLGFAQLLEMDLPAEQREPVTQIRRAGRHLLDLIHEVLDIAKIEAGHLSLSSETVQVDDLVGEAVELMAPVAAEHEVSLHADPGGSCTSYVRADRQRAKQVLLNLISNAIKYNRAGGSVSVRCRIVDASAAIEVEDTGIGIGEHELDRLFVPFERLSAGRSDIEGTGVGLALSQRLAVAMDGRIEVTSAVGLGSTFSFCLPLADDPAEAQSPARPGPDASAPAVPPGAVPANTVLSIEDNLANTRLLQQIVARRPTWRMLSAAQGQLRLDLASANPPQLILLDLHLPDVPGVQVLRRLKAAPATAHVPIVVVSADATVGQAKRMQALGAAAYLTKPIEVAAILELLDESARAPGGAR